MFGGQLGEEGGHLCPAHLARMAQTKVKKPEICTYWWEKVIQYEPTHEEALSELYKLYERNKENIDREIPLGHTGGPDDLKGKWVLLDFWGNW